ncbi:MAG TPA: peptidoglycan editing factor PgeF [Thermoanaerobaculia bacterium]|nr:peptidoglycan editing factor PgeF [Thermoanaerobaculia bacterium]
MHDRASPRRALLDAAGDVRVAFLGRDEGPADDLESARRRLAVEVAAAAPRRAAENRQVHSARAVVAVPGTRPEADALISSERDLGLAVYTADCLPLLIAGPTAIAAIHAGWRGLAGGVVAAALARLPDPPDRLSAWIGPAMGPCCYQVSEEVAYRVAAASTGAAWIPRLPRPHLDLAGAAKEQLDACGVADVRLLAHCTGCEHRRFWSYRRHGATGRRNYALIWRRR